MRVYLDNAATTPLAPEVLEAMMPFFKEHYGNPSAQHSFGRTTRSAVEQARKTVASCINAKASEIVFTSGGTESNNLALTCAVRDLDVKRIIANPIEHHCVLHTIDYLASAYNIAIEYVKLEDNGAVNLAHLEHLLKESEQKTLVTIMHGNNEIGILCPLQQIGALCQQYDALFHSDSVQTMAHYPFDMATLKVDFLTGSAHKFHGPKGIGFLYTRKGLQMTPIIHGGGQERQKRAGTENLYGIIGLAKAMEIAYQNLDEERQQIIALKEYLYHELKKSFDITINGSEDFEQSLYTVLNVSFPPDSRGPLLIFNLDMEGVCVSGGSACTSGAATGSHVIKALCNKEDRVNIRFSFSRYTTQSDLDFALEKIKKVFNIAVKC